MANLDLGQFHVVVLHFPIVLFWTAFVYDILGAFFKVNSYPAAHWFLMIAAATAVPTVITGLLAFHFKADNPYVLIHRNWALITFSFAFFYALYRFYLLHKRSPGPKILLVILSGITVLLISITAEYGGKVAFGF
ncbi:MAG: DUF2231 domain-containing protein [Rhabdochlamydiaceae bacterium]|nr:DUF2231 domain-containing protein [Rhabdochlamydiaceae bacterium]